MKLILAICIVDNVTVHGFRSSFRDWAGDETSYPRDLIETALAHVIGDKSERAYRRSDVLEKRRNLMESMCSVLRAAIAREHHSTCGARQSWSLTSSRAQLGRRPERGDNENGPDVMLGNTQRQGRVRLGLGKAGRGES